MIWKILFVILIYFPLNAQFEGSKYDILQNEISGPLNYVKQPFDVKQYDAEINLTKFPLLDMSGVCRILLQWEGSPIGNKFFFHLRDLTIDSVFYENISVDPVEVGTKDDPDYHFEISPPPQISASSVIITIYYHGRMTYEYNKTGKRWGGVQYSRNTMFAMGVGFYNNYVSSTQHWLPCYDLPSDKAFFKCKFITPKNIFVASNGLLVEKNFPNDSTTEYLWFHNNDCATYNYTFAASEYLKLEFGNQELPMDVYCRQTDSLNSSIQFKLLPKMVKTYEKYFGKYPFDKVGYVLTPIGSMEHETMISFSDKITWDKDTVNETGAHELAHMWFGDMVTPFDFRDAWLNEAFATFCESIWYEDLFDFESYLIHQDDMRFNYIYSDNGSKYESVFPIYDFPRTQPSSNYPLTIYQKGGSVVGMLRYELGDSLFFLSMREYLNKCKYGNATTEILSQTCEQISGKDLDWFFDQWVFGKGWPRLKVRWMNDLNGKCRVDISQVQQDDYGMYSHIPIEIGFVNQNDQISYKLFEMNSKVDSFITDLGFDAKMITINSGPTVRSLIEVVDLANPVSDFETISNIELLPNPANNQILVNFESRTGITEMSIYDIHGDMKVFKRLETMVGINNIKIETGQLSSGEYFLTIANNGKVQYGKFVVKH